MCNTQRLSNKVYQFNGFSFYNSLERANYWKDHGHEEIQITLPQSNSMARMHYQTFNGKQVSRRIRAGQAFLVSPHQSHQLEWQHEAELTLFYLHPNFLSATVENSKENSCWEIRDRFSLVQDPLIQEVGVIFRYLRNSGIATETLYIENLANLLAIHLIKNYLNYKFKIPRLDRGLSQKRLKRVLEYIEANLDRKITLADLAGTAGMGKFYFCRSFKSSLHLTPYQYVLQQRVERAKKLLKHSDISICNVALDCGFSSQSHLTKHFRSMLDTSPMNYRKTNK